MFQKWDEYCERVGFGLFAEPLNAITNVSFLVAALATVTPLRPGLASAPPALLCLRPRLILGCSPMMSSLSSRRSITWPCALVTTSGPALPWTITVSCPRKRQRLVP